MSRRDVPLPGKTLWQMLYETAARASEVLALNVEDLDVGGRRAAVRSKGGDVKWFYWASGTARMLPRLLGRARGPVFPAARRPAPGQRPHARDVCPRTCRGRLRPEVITLASAGPCDSGCPTEVEELLADRGIKAGKQVQARGQRAPGEDGCLPHDAPQTACPAE